MDLDLYMDLPTNCLFTLSIGVRPRLLLCQARELRSFNTAYKVPVNIRTPTSLNVNSNTLQTKATMVTSSPTRKASFSRNVYRKLFTRRVEVFLQF
jgi:hypothetical protein